MAEVAVHQPEEAEPHMAESTESERALVSTKEETKEPRGTTAAQSVAELSDLEVVLAITW